MEEFGKGTKALDSSSTSRGGERKSMETLEETPKLVYL